MTYYVYMLECSNGNYYTGYTTDIKRRYQEHLDGSPKCKYTRSFPPRRLAACWQVEDDLSIALKAERKIKGLSRLDKLALIAEPAGLLELFPQIILMPAMLSL